MTSLFIFFIDSAKQAVTAKCVIFHAVLSLRRGREDTLSSVKKTITIFSREILHSQDDDFQCKLSPINKSNFIRSRAVI